MNLINIKKFSKLFSWLLLILFGLYITGIYRWIDINVFNERGKEITGYIIYNEDWTKIIKEKIHYDYRWTKINDNRILVAHALGGSGTVNNNTITEMMSAYENKLQIMEVDIFKDKNNVLRCHHGPEQPQELQDNDCTFGKIINIAEELGIYLVIDIKSDFKSVGNEIVEKINSNQARFIIFQLYKPEHLNLFNEWARMKPLIGPIITTYRARQSIKNIQKAIVDSGFEVLTIPSYRLPAIVDQFRGNIKIFTHPTHSCEEYLMQKKFKISGFFITNKILDKIENECKSE